MYKSCCGEIAVCVCMVVVIPLYLMVIAGILVLVEACVREELRTRI